MNSLRLARTLSVRAVSSSSSSLASRSMATTTTAPPTARPIAQSMIPVSNIEAQWEQLSNKEQLEVYEQLLEAQKKDWKTLSIDEKKAAYYISFGPHGPRKPVDEPGSGLKIFGLSSAIVAAACVGFGIIRAYGGTPPKTLTKEWEEKSNELALEDKSNPITGISSEGYKGKGYVVSK